MNDDLKAAKGCRTLRLLLGDQLTPRISSLRGADRARDIILMAEVMTEATHVRHHKKKIAFLFSAMRHFADELQTAGWQVEYVRLLAPANTGSLVGEVQRIAAEHDAQRVVVTEPGEWRLKSDMAGWSERLGLPVELCEDDRFLCSHAEFRHWAQGRRTFRMEFFYREMRRKHGLLLDAMGEPEGGKWNFDAANRKPLPPNFAIPDRPSFMPDAITQEVLALVGERFADHFGDLAPFDFAVTRAGAEAAADWFFEVALPCFGDYQDAMRQREPLLFHAHLSMYLNCGLLDPLDLCRRAEAEYHAGRVPLNAAEGFIRQILGWREYVRGVYWLDMPAYAESNHLNANRPLPWLYWSGETQMNCMAQVIGETKRNAYAHHIQRLMVTGNFALLAGLRPAEVEEWYLVVYADAYDWVELPNTHGMALFADGGRLASKPYAASGKYIDRMSDYCKSCRYKVGKTVGTDACPFNALYWDFLMRNAEKLNGNPRLAMPYRNLARMAPERRAEIREQAARFLAGLQQGENKVVPRQPELFD